MCCTVMLCCHDACSELAVEAADTSVTTATTAETVQFKLLCLWCMCLAAGRFCTVAGWWRTAGRVCRCLLFPQVSLQALRLGLSTHAHHPSAQLCQLCSKSAGLQTCWLYLQAVTCSWPTLCVRPACVCVCVGVTHKSNSRSVHHRCANVSRLEHHGIGFLSFFSFFDGSWEHLGI